jgi:hypothetical protein
MWSVACCVLENAHELILVHSTIFVSFVGFVDHLFKLFVSHLLTKLSSNFLQIFQGDELLLFREQDKGFLELRVGITLRHFHGHNLFEIVVVDGNQAFLVLFIGTIPVFRTVVQSLDESLDFLRGRLKAESA